MSTGPAINSLAPWLGAKRQLAPQIIDLIGQHSAYWEPFCGSCAVLLAKPPCQAETANDLHSELVALAGVLAFEPTAIELYQRTSRTLLHEALFEEAAARVADRQARDVPPLGPLQDVDRAADFMLASWAGRNGLAGSTSGSGGFAARFTSNGGHPATRWRSAVESIPWWHERLRGVCILHRCGFEVLGRIEDKPGTVIYVDPPYLVKGAKYLHDFKPADHQRLADALSRFKRTRVVVSYYAHPQVEALYPGWTLHAIPVTRNIAQQGGKAGAQRAVEVLLVNQP